MQKKGISVETMEFEINEIGSEVQYKGYGLE